MAIPTLHNVSLLNAQMRAVSLKMGEPYDSLPTQSVLAALVKHGGMYTLLDPDFMAARMAAFVPEPSVNAEAVEGTAAPVTAADIAKKLQEVAANFFYRLVDQPGYTVHSELMAYISEPGEKNGVAYDPGADASPDVPAAFTFVGQFIDHDLTFNGMNLTVNQQGVIADDASPVIDLDSVYGPRKNAPKFHKVFDKKGRFIHREFDLEGGKKGFDVPRNDEGTATILDPRNDENQLILQIHLLIQRFHNKLIDCGALKTQLAALPDPHDVGQIVDCVRREVVATWQSFILNEYMPAVLDSGTLQHVIQQIHVKATDPNHPEKQYGDLKHKPYRDLVTGKNVVRMPHEFAIGFRFGHSQLRPSYVLNAKSVVLLFKDARASAEVEIEGSTIKVSGKDDLRGGRKLAPEHVIDWKVFYPTTPADKTNSLRIDHKVTARVFNLPESAIPDDIKYIGNLPHRNLIRGSQIGVVSGEEVADFYGIARLTPDQVLGSDAGREAAKDLFKLDHPPHQPGHFKTPLWYYFLKEGEVASGGTKLGKAGSRLVAEVLAGALYYGNDFPYDDNWKSSAIKPATGTPPNKVTLRDIIDYVEKPCPPLAK
ncbi:MAG TPA: peroxidase family protein [Thermoanaerobaculia bacterium]|jgi:hypothetical protein|nr:peroxidase family protein [Thermoanaerobaculia bacterium]